VRLDLREQGFEVPAGELPLEGTGSCAIVILEAQQAILELGAGVKVVLGKHPALEDREVHLDLVEPTGVHGGVYRDGRRPAPAQALDAGVAVVRGAVVHDPEHPRGGSVGLLPHDLPDEAAAGTNPGLRFGTGGNHDP